jgi:hypothetical protein
VSEEPERWVQIWDAWPGFRVSWDGNFYADARKSPSGRNQKAQPIATTTTKDGYVLVKYLDKDGKRVTRQAHRVVLENFEFKGGPIPEHLQSRHYDDIGTNNKWRPGATEEESHARGGNLFVGNAEHQYQDKVRNGLIQPPPEPKYPCRNHAEGCANRVTRENRRCQPCVAHDGRQIATRLRRTENLLKVARKYGYSTKWAHRIAREYGGYEGSYEDALRQRPPLWHRVAATVRDRGPGHRRHDESPQARAGFGEAPRAGALRAASPVAKVEQSGTSWTPPVTQRDPREHRPPVPYPADITPSNRTRRPFGAGRNR